MILEIGFGLAVVAALGDASSSPPPSDSRPHPGRIISSPNWSDYHNYPAEARRYNQEGAVVFSLEIDRTGKPVSCSILASSQFPSLDAGTCALANKMRFEPARGADNQAVESTYRTRVFWLLDSPRPFASSQLDAKLMFAGDQLISCTVEGQGPYVQPWKSIICRDSQMFPDKLKANGAMPARVTASVRLDAGDGLLANPNWPAGAVLARDSAKFSINSEGEAAECTAEADGNVFTNDFRSQDPCGHFLSTIWFEAPGKKDPKPLGQFEFRLIAQTAD